jgi:hypothetical protein
MERKNSGINPMKFVRMEFFFQCESMCFNIERFKYIHEYVNEMHTHTFHSSVQ